MLVARGFLLHICQSQMLWGFEVYWTVKIQGFEIFQGINQEGVDTVLVTVAH